MGPPSALSRKFSYSDKKYQDILDLVWDFSTQSRNTLQPNIATQLGTLEHKSPPPNRGCPQSPHCTAKYNSAIGHDEFSSVQFSSVQFSSVQFSSVQFSSVQFSSVQFSSVQFSSVQFSSVQFSSVQFSSVQFSSVQFSSVQFSSVQFTISYWYTSLSIYNACSKCKGTNKQQEMKNSDYSAKVC